MPVVAYRSNVVHNNSSNDVDELQINSLIKKNSNLTFYNLAI